MKKKEKKKRCERKENTRKGEEMTRIDKTIKEKRKKEEIMEALYIGYKIIYRALIIISNK